MIEPVKPTEVQHMPILLWIKGCLPGLLLIVLFAFSLLIPFSAQAQQANQLTAIVQVDSIIPHNARTAAGLGTSRTGSGVVIDDEGLVLTIGYIILEAIEVSVRGPLGNKVPADVIAYDHETGFGLLRTQTPIDVQPLPFGESGDIAVMEPLLAASHVGKLEVRGVHLVNRRPFAGYWEYLLEDAMFTAPPHPQFGGAALINRHGELVGIGSLVLRDQTLQGRQRPANMFIPIDDLKPILEDLISEGRRGDEAHPWLGLFLEEYRGRIFVTRVAPGGPGQDAGMLVDDLILGIDGNVATSLADFYRELWQRGKPGVEIPLDVVRDDDMSPRIVKSGDRYEYLRLDPTF